MICLDTNWVIYLVESNPSWGPKIVARLATARTAGDALAVCDLARAECPVGPLKNGDAALVADYRRFFASPDVQILPLTAAVCERAPEIRVASSLAFELPHALHLAAAVVHGCGVFLTNDAKLARCTAVAVEVLT
jgi:predicted nucleic acid-binding protein